MTETSTFGDTVDAFRCPDVRDGRRCQLYADHDGAHAAAWTEGRADKAGGYRFRWIRWDADRVWEQEPGSERLGWCAMHRP